MVQDGKVVVFGLVQDVRGRYNANNQGRPFQRNNARGNGIAGNVGGQSDLQDSDYFKDKMLLMQAQEVRCAVLVEELVLFLAGDRCDAFDYDVDEGPIPQTMFQRYIRITSERSNYDDSRDIIDQISF
ncbi:hypothetical protein Tco_0266173 [Tanacetum coccineum]